jgi:hypothetical protein
VSLCAEHGQFPGPASFIVAHDIDVAILPLEFEIAMIGSKPRVKNVGNLDSTVREDQRPRRLFAAMSCVTLDVDLKQALRRHHAEQVFQLFATSRVRKSSPCAQHSSS